MLSHENHYFKLELAKAAPVVSCPDVFNIWCGRRLYNNVTALLEHLILERILRPGN